MDVYAFIARLSLRRPYDGCAMADRKSDTSSSQDGLELYVILLSASRGMGKEVVFGWIEIEQLRIHHHAFTQFPTN